MHIVTDPLLYSSRPIWLDKNVTDCMCQNAIPLGLNATQHKMRRENKSTQTSATEWPILETLKKPMLGTPVGDADLLEVAGQRKIKTESKMSYQTGQLAFMEITVCKLTPLLHFMDYSVVAFPNNLKEIGTLFNSTTAKTREAWAAQLKPMDSTFGNLWTYCRSYLRLFGQRSCGAPKPARRAWEKIIAVLSLPAVLITGQK